MGYDHRDERLLPCKLKLKVLSPKNDNVETVNCIAIEYTYLESLIIHLENGKQLWYNLEKEGD